MSAENDLVVSSDPEITRMKSSFAEQDMTLIVGGERLFINKSELMAKSPVFEKMFTADFKEKNANYIELPDKNLHEFLLFLRCTLDGFQDIITDNNVHLIIPFAHEYQVETMLSKADMFLANKYTEKQYGGCTSAYVIKCIIEAEKYTLEKSLEILTDYASRKVYHIFSTKKGYDQLSDTILYRIAMKRWKNNINPESGVNYTFRSYPQQVL
ncbi:unnamed protein product [Mytilus edulis]|uniref:BTB domain-containing protein n=1 Tax=Mytilus edulis TaxID=6550 RepID=A0A8S3UKT4_MYTED|nr:unnamed protein product [Mytilus edulis]